MLVFAVSEAQGRVQRLLTRWALQLDQPPLGSPDGGNQRLRGLFSFSPRTAPLSREAHRSAKTRGREVNRFV